MKQFKSSIPFLFSFILLFFILYMLIDTITKQKINNLLHLEIDKLKTHYNINMEYEKEVAQTAYIDTISNQKAIDIFSEAWNTKDKNKRKELRKELFNLVKKEYLTLKNMGVLQYHFVFPNNETFLRMHKPDKFGDNLGEIRHDFKYVNETKKIVRGLSPGKTAHAFRNIYPIYDKEKNYIGCLDIAFPSEVLQHKLTKISNLHSHFLLNKHVLDSKLWGREDTNLDYHQSTEHKDYLLAMTDDHVKYRCIFELRKHLENKREFISQSFLKGEAFSFYTKFYKKITLISFLPIKDNINNNNIAWLVSYVPDKANLVKSLINLDHILKIISFFILAMIIYFIYNILNQKKLLAQEVKNKTLELEDINQNLAHKVEDEVEKNLAQQLQLFEQSKMATMGAMIGNIAHQWRQPLSVISTTASTVSLQKEMGIFDQDTLEERMETINNQVNYLSDTIDTFRNFLKEKKEFKKVVLQDRIKVSLSIVGVALKDNNIKIIENIDYDNPIEIELIIGELSQIIINIINNARDILLEKKIQNPWVKIELTKDEKNVYIKIEDNGGGVPKNIIKKIFDEYFTTKENTNGTGLGLHMSKKIVKESFNGDLIVENTSNGACFTIIIPL